MSGEVTTKKRKSKGKKKAILEALQQEEYRDEREHNLFVDEEEQFMYQPPPPSHLEQDEQEDDMAYLIEDGEESSGSGCCTKLLFLLLISVFGVAVGVVFFELGGVNGPLSELPSFPKLPDLPDLPELPSLSNLPSFSDIEKMINDIKAPWFDSEPPAPEPTVEQPHQQEPENEFIEPTPTETEPVVEETSPEEPVIEEPVIREAAQIVQSPPEEIVEVTTEAPEATTEPSVFEEPENVPQAVEVPVSEVPIVEEPQQAPVEEVSEIPVPEVVAETPVLEEVTETPVPEEVTETPVPEEVTETPVLEEVTETPVPEEVTEIPVPEEVTETPVPEEVTETPVPEEVTETPVPEEVTETPVREEVTETPVREEVVETPVEVAPVEEIPTESHLEPQVDHTAEVPQVEETPTESHFEPQLEDDTAEVPEESYTMRAEREAVQDAIDNVWVLTVRCIEELRALQSVAKTAQTLQSVDEISSRLEPLRFELDDLARGTSDNNYDSALERAAGLERGLRGVLDALDEARTLDDLLASQIQRKQDELAAQQDAVESEPAQESQEEIVYEEPQVEDALMETAEDDVTRQTRDEQTMPVEHAPSEPTVAVEIVEQSEAPAVEEPVEQLTDAQSLAEEISEEPAIPIENAAQDQLSVEEPSTYYEDQPPVAQEEPAWAEEVAQSDAAPAVEVITPETFEAVQVEQVSVDPVPIQEPVPETAPVVQPIAEHQVEEQVPVSLSQPEPAPEQSTESPQVISTESPQEPKESQPVDEPVQVAKEAFLVEPAEQMAAPATTESPSVVNNLEETDRLVDQSPGEALKMMEEILEQVPTNPLALYGRARSLDTLAEVERSNARLEQAIFAYRAVLDLEDSVDDNLYRRAALRCIDRMRFRGFHGKAIRIQQRMVARFPDEVDLQNQLAVSFLITNQAEAAKTILEGVLQRWPESGFAQVHLGFILKTTYDDYEAGAGWMRSGINTRHDGVIDGRFYFHLGDALIRLGRREEAQQVFIEGEKERVFLSRDQRSLYNVDRLTGKPWWDKESTTYGPFFDLMEANWQSIRDEGVALLDLNPPEGFADETEKLKNTGDWKQFELFVQGRKNAANCEKAPKTCALIEMYPPALCRRGQVKFSVMHPGTHVWAHTGPTNCRIRSHLGLVVPEGLALRVANETRTWEEGKFVIFDDSFEHEVWHTGSSYRLVLIVDLWHPELTPEERRSLPAI